MTNSQIQISWFLQIYMYIVCTPLGMCVPSFNFVVLTAQGFGNFEIWIGQVDDDDIINEPISKKKNMYISPVTKTNDNWQSYNSF